MAGFDSYQHILEKYCLQVKPETILEWGPGGSTSLMLKHTTATIYSIEHEHRWMERAFEQFKDEPRVKLYHITDEDEYCEPDFGFKYQLIFVDGLCAWRNHCLEYSKSILDEGGVVILHDSERVIYHPGWKPHYEMIEENNGTMVLKPLTSD